MAYSFQTFTLNQVLTSAQVNQLEANIRDHTHGLNSVNATINNAQFNASGSFCGKVHTDGNFLISPDGGDVTPAYALTLHSSTTTNVGLHMYHSGSAASGALIDVESTGNLNINNTESGADLIFATDSTRRLKVDSNGGVVISSSEITPSHSLVLHNTGSAEEYMQFVNGTTGSTSGDGFQIGISISEAAIIHNQEATNLEFYIQGARKFYWHTASNGFVVGAPTGNGKGNGTINAQAVYDDNVLLTDYVFDLHIDGAVKKEDLKQAKSLLGNKKILDIDYFIDFWSENHSLPSMPTRDEFEKNGMSIGMLAQRLWETVEIQSIHMAQLNDRLKYAENKLKQLK